MSDARVTKLAVVDVKTEVRQETVEMLEEMLAEAKAGKIEQVMIVATRANGGYMIGVTRGLSRLQRLGALETMKFDILNAAEEL